MDVLKKSGIAGGAVVGGVIGGTLSIIGRLSKNKFLDELGGNIVDSTITTGQIAGQVASGATDIVVGSFKHSPQHLITGKRDMKEAGGKVVHNYVSNAKLIIENGGEIIQGVRQRDAKKIRNGARTLGKIVAIGALTVGAIKVKPDDQDAPAK